MKLGYKIFLLLLCVFVLQVFPQPKNNFQHPTQWRADSHMVAGSNQYPVYQPKVDIPHPDYRNRVNLPEYDPSLMPLKSVRTGTGVWTELNPKVPRVDYLGIHFITKIPAGLAVLMVL